MTHSDIQIITAGAEEIVINRNELAERLHTDRNFTAPLLEHCQQRLQQVIRYRCACIRTSVDLSTDNICDFGFMTIPSHALYRNLNGCQEVFIMALTTGIAVDRLLSRLNITSQAEHFMTDALSSAAIESFCDVVCDRLRKGLSEPLPKLQQLYRWSLQPKILQPCLQNRRRPPLCANPLKFPP